MRAWRWGVVVGIVLAGRYLLDHLFRLVASAGAREVMTAAALLVVLAAAMAGAGGGGCRWRSAPSSRA